MVGIGNLLQTIGKVAQAPLKAPQNLANALGGLFGGGGEQQDMGSTLSTILDPGGIFSQNDQEQDAGTSLGNILDPAGLLTQGQGEGEEEELMKKYGQGFQGMC